MELTFVTDLGQSFTIEIDSKMELENVMALLEAEVSGFRRCIAQAQVSFLAASRQVRYPT
jgi:hypothetical protein